VNKIMERIKTENRILIIGAGGHAKVVFDIAEKLGKCVIGFFDEISAIENFNDIKVYKHLDDIVEVCDNNVYIFIAIGDNYARQNVYNRIVEKIEFPNFATLIDPSAVVSNSNIIDQGTVVMPGAIINSHTKVGKHCIVNTGAQLDHDCKMDDFSSVGPGVICGGNVSIGKNSAICLGANIIEKINIGAGSIIGSGSVVLKDVPKNVLVHGIPAKVKENISGKRKYLK
jgi:acetyltransferase EpsM